MSDRIKWGESYESLAQNISQYLPQQSVPTMVYSPSTYPIWWDKTLTIYNRYENPLTQLVTWYKTKLTNCFIQSSRTYITGGQINYSSNNDIIRIPQDTRYIEYFEWINIPNINQGEYFTLHAGDIIIKGDVDDVIDEYQSGKRSSDVVDKYKNLGLCITIDNWQDNTGTGRVCPHYYVSGE